MIYTAIDTFYLTDEQLKNSPSRKDDIDESTELLLSIYGCNLIQESRILFRLPQAVMATGQQVVFGWLQNWRNAPGKTDKFVFHRVECRRENLPMEHLDIGSKEMGFLCHPEHPRKFISNYLRTLEAPDELRQEAWNLANDSFFLEDIEEEKM